MFAAVSSESSFSTSLAALFVFLLVAAAFECLPGDSGFAFAVRLAFFFPGGSKSLSSDESGACGDGLDLIRAPRGCRFLFNAGDGGSCAFGASSEESDERILFFADFDLAFVGGLGTASLVVVVVLLTSNSFLLEIRPGWLLFFSFAKVGVLVPRLVNGELDSAAVDFVRLRRRRDTGRLCGVAATRSLIPSN